MEIALGSAQFGLDYGISNAIGKTGQGQVCDILSLAASEGVTCIDTAALYGNAEEVLGACDLQSKPWRLITKTPKVEGGCVGQLEVDLMRRRFDLSLQQLKLGQVDGLLLHRYSDFFLPGGDLIYQFLGSLKAQGKVNKIGVSVYTAEQIDQILAQFDIDIIQLPMNIFDQRLVRSGHLQKLKEAGVEIHVRSVFLQGLVMMPAEVRPAYFNPITGTLDSFSHACAEFKITPLAAALQYIEHISEVDYAVVGVNTLNQMAEIISANKCEIGKFPFESFAINDSKFVNPAEWAL